MDILAIETSCDETACAVVRDGIELISSTIATSKELHEKTGGIVPEVASRKQVESIVPVIEQTVKEAYGELNFDKVDKIAVTIGPGLMGSLVVGVEAAKALSLALDKPFIPINHLVGHIYANWIKGENSEDLPFPPQLPAIVLIVSGGHTDLVLMKDHGDMEYLGGTLDDAAGEAFDKTARLLGIKKYLGGPELSKIASGVKESSISGKLPRPKIKDDDFDFSFSGLKTAARRIIEQWEGDVDVESVSKEFEDAVVDVLVSKTIKAAEEKNVKTILLGGGVSANKPLRKRLKLEAKELGIDVYVPPINLCTDNAIYIASAAYFVGVKKNIDGIEASPSLGVTDLIT